MLDLAYKITQLMTCNPPSRKASDGQSRFERHQLTRSKTELKDKRFYTGLTTNLKNRLRQHAHGEVKSTKDRRPLKLIRCEYFINEDAAKSREIFLKSGFGRNQLK